MARLADISLEKLDQAGRESFCIVAIARQPSDPDLLIENSLQKIEVTGRQDVAVAGTEGSEHVGFPITCHSREVASSKIRCNHF